MENNKKNSVEIVLKERLVKMSAVFAQIEIKGKSIKKNIRHNCLAKMEKSGKIIKTILGQKIIIKKNNGDHVRAKLNNYI